MPQSLSNVIVHAVFSTHHRVPCIAPDTGPKLHAYLAGILNNQGSRSLCIGGHADHVHLMFELARTRCISETIGTVKTASTKWMKDQSSLLHEFSWQAGYATFSVGRSEVIAVQRYIQTQDEHHRVRTFQEEMREFFQEYGIEFDERYVWD